MDKKYIHNIWFPKATKEIVIIVSEEAETKKSEDSATTAENYAYLDNVGDKDTLFEVSIFLARHYPNASLKTLFPREFNEREDLNKNLVIIGGPAHNETYSRFKKKLNTSIGYNLENWTITMDEKSYESDYSEEIGMQVDYGSFSSFRNPFMNNHRVILINGISTFGAHGAFYAFSDKDEAIPNYIYICEKMSMGDNIGFEVLVSVNVHNCHLRDCTKVSIDCPHVNSENIKTYHSLAHAEVSNSLTEGRKIMITNSDKKRVDLLQRKLSSQITTRIRLIDSLAKTRDPLLEQQYEDDLEKCEITILSFAQQLAELSLNYDDIEIESYLSADLVEICRKRVSKISSNEFVELKNELLNISQRISEDAKSNGDDDVARKAISIASDITKKDSLELTIPIIPLLLNYKSSISLDTKLDLKNAVCSLIKKIKGTD